MGAESGSTRGTRSSAGIAPDTHALDSDQNTINENGALLKKCTMNDKMTGKLMVEN
jgi:hypothetical protein